MQSNHASSCTGMWTDCCSDCVIRFGMLPIFKSTEGFHFTTNLLSFVLRGKLGNLKLPCDLFESGISTTSPYFECSHNKKG